MLTVAGREVMVRQRRRFVGWWGFGVGTLSMFVSSFSVTVLALVVVIGTDPWYAPQYAIPLLGMILGNTMNGISLGLDRLTQDAAQDGWSSKPGWRSAMTGDGRFPTAAARRSGLA
jgi:putative ABC transport system permease protein